MTHNEQLFEPVETNRVSDSTIDQILSLITSGQLQPGDQLPSERTLIKRLEVGRTSLREALRALEAIGIIEVRPGVGSFVKNLSPATAMSSQWIPWLVTHEPEIMELVELRQALETRAASLAAERANAEQRDAIRATLRQMEQAIADGDMPATIEADKSFHEALAAASHNSLIADVLRLANNALAETREAVLSLPNRPTKSLAEHWLVWEAIEAHDPVKAEETVLNHISGVVNDIQQISHTTETVTPSEE